MDMVAVTVVTVAAIILTEVGTMAQAIMEEEAAAMVSDITDQVTVMVRAIMAVITRRIMVEAIHQQ
jgi:uncharacterized membrane protein